MSIKSLIGLAAIFAPALLPAQQGYLIKGEVGHLNAPAKAYLFYKVNGQDHLDSANITNGHFVFKGLVGAPKSANLKIIHGDLPEMNPVTRPQDDLLGFIIEDKTILIVGKDSVRSAAIKGSPANEDNKQITVLLKPHYDKYQALNAEYKAQTEEKQRDSAYINTLESRAKAIGEEIIAVKMKYVKANPGKYMALMAFNSTLPESFDAIEAEKVFNTLDAMNRKSDLGLELQARIAKVKKTQDGAIAPDFTQSDVNGHPVKLSDFRGKWVLLDFWASWCGPCRRENPNLVKTYEAYKDKGFAILGVSLDKPADKDKWVAAIEKDGLNWTQVSDLKSWDNEAAKLYEVTAIPMNFLINPEGKIVAKYLRGAELDKKLQELIK